MFSWLKLSIKVISFKKLSCTSVSYHRNFRAIDNLKIPLVDSLPWSSFIAHVKPLRVQRHTVARLPPEPNLSKISKSTMNVSVEKQLINKLTSSIEINVSKDIVIAGKGVVFGIFCDNGLRSLRFFAGGSLQTSRWVFSQHSLKSGWRPW